VKSARSSAMSGAEMLWSCNDPWTP
jgi:hypothetical protein